MPFYKRENDELMVAPNFVVGPGFELHAESHAEHTYPVEGWYWFDNLDAAMAALVVHPAVPVTLDSKLDALWRAADSYTSRYISGVAIGILTIGTLQQLPKSLAVTAWSSSIWDEYYRRKALVTEASEDDLDFSSFGPMPHSVPELREELGL